MTSRSLTEVFILMRNNALQSRHIYSEQQSSSDRVRLVHSGSRDDALVETGNLGMEMRGDTQMPPPWIDSLEEAQYLITRISSKIEELCIVHKRHLQRPTLDDSGVEEQQIGRLTAELTRNFNTAHRHVTTIKAQCLHGNVMERRLTRNVVMSLVTSLQESSTTFRTAQSMYLRSLTSREERSNAYFELPNFDELNLNDEDTLPTLRSTQQTDNMFTFGPSVSGTSKNGKSLYDDDNSAEVDEIFQRPAMSQKQLLHFQEQNTEMAKHREEEVNKIVRSILDLNDIFKDLAHMVQDQGTVLDRIDYNIEQTHVQVQEGYKQLKKADSYQRKNRKMQCILCLGFTIIILIILLIVIKS